MSIVIKKIGKNKYAYFAMREGKKVVHKYLGSIDSPKVVRIISEKKKISAIPERLSYLFWDTDLKNIHIKKNARYIIERILEYGDIDSLEWMQKVYPVHRIIDVLKMTKAITTKSNNFWVLWFGADDV